MLRHPLITQCKVLHIQVCTGMYEWFRGAHRDAAMPPPDADHASKEEGDPLPCPEDEEFFIPGLMLRIWKSMEQEERTGYNALHKLLQGIPVPVQKDANSMR